MTTPTTPDAIVQLLGRHIANECLMKPSHVSINPENLVKISPVWILRLRGEKNTEKTEAQHITVRRVRMQSELSNARPNSPKQICRAYMYSATWS